MTLKLTEQSTYFTAHYDDQMTAIASLKALTECEPEIQAYFPEKLF